MDKRAGLYVRVSTSEQAKEGYSIGAQTEKLKAFAMVKDYTVEKIYTDPGFSGSKLDRPGMSELIDDVINKRIDVVMVHKLDRLSRSQKDTLHLIQDIFKPNNVDFISIEQSFDTSTSFGMAMVGILSVFAELERSTISERMMMGRIERAKKGLFRGGNNVPLGYSYTDGELVLDGDAHLVAAIFERYTDGESAYSIYKDLHANYPGKIYGANMIPRILANATYTGSVVFKGEVYDGEHEAIVSKELFAVAQQMLSNTPDKYKVAKNKRAALLARKLYCGNCGANMTMHRHHGKDGAADYGYYRCNSRRKSRPASIKDPDCKQKHHRTDNLNEAILNALDALDYNAAVASVRKKDVGYAESKRLTEIIKQEKRLLDLYQYERINISELDQRMIELQDEKKRLHKPKASAKEARIIEQLDTLQTADIHALPFAEQCEVVDTLIDRIIISGDDVDIRFKF